MNIETRLSGFYLTFPFNRKTVEIVKTIPGRRWNPTIKQWVIPLTSGKELAAVYTQLTGKSAPAEVLDAGTAEVKRVERKIDMSKAHTAPVVVEGLGGTLDNYQKAGVAYALAAKRVIIGDAPGLGKTVEALATIHAANAYPAVLVVPATVKINWQRETNKWLPGKTVQIVNGTKDTINTRNDVYIINYDILTHYVDTIIKHVKPKAVVIDECHMVKNSKAKRSKAVKSIADGAEYVLGLSGTAILNRPSELIHQLEVIDRLENFGGFWHFANHYCGAYRDRFGLRMDGANNLSELNTKLRATCYIRREKADVLKDLPAKRKAIVPVEITNRPDYDRAVDDLISYLMDEVTQDKAFTYSISKLNAEDRKSALNARRQDVAYKARQAEHLVRINALKRLTARGKMKAIIDWIQDFLDTGEKLVVFGHHKEMVQGLAKHFNAPYIDGGVSQVNRQKAVDRFQNDESCKLIVLNMQAGGVGITLTAASNVVFTELPWSPALLDQATDRCHRRGQKDSVTAWYLLGAGTIDEEVASLLDKKQNVTDAVNIGEHAEFSPSILNTLLDSLRKRS